MLTRIVAVVATTHREQRMFPEYTLIHLPEGPDDNVLLLDIPRDAQRIWVDEKYRNTPTLRDLEGFGPRGHRPVGYLLPDDRIIADGSGLAKETIAYLKTFFTGEMRHVNDTADFPDGLIRKAHFGKCTRCGNIDGKKHAASCPHAGKLVGDKVR